jgi:hypothetical protein
MIDVNKQGNLGGLSLESFLLMSDVDVIGCQHVSAAGLPVPTTSALLRERPLRDAAETCVCRVT